MPPSKLARSKPLLFSRSMATCSNLLVPNVPTVYDGFVALDFEFKDEITEIGAVYFIGSEVQKVFSRFVAPSNNNHTISSFPRLTFYNSMPTFSQCIIALLEFIGNKPVIAHSCGVEIRLLTSALNKIFPNQIIDNLMPQDFFCTYRLAKKFKLSSKDYRLKTLADELDLNIETKFHIALNDSLVTFEIWCKIRQHVIGQCGISPDMYLEFLKDVMQVPTPLMHQLTDRYHGRELLIKTRNTADRFKDRKRIKSLLSPAM